MLWVTRPRLHLDRVASPWLVDRFVDADAKFDFVDEGEDVPADAIALTIPGAELGPLDADGSTFRKILRKYSITDPVLVKMADCVEAGIAISLQKDLPQSSQKDLPPLSEDLLQHAASLAFFAEGMAVLYPDDHENLRQSFPFYDALYISMWANYGEGAPGFPEHPRKRIDQIQEARDWTAFFGKK
ncbi:chromate resistance protein ChrB domain-containing protein [Rhodococcus sp. NPDC019627]|uniref:chromate resistance protein ChrB domain-containing protein n=1 Tax=unclassified Rhodococcus (in: high G+C Gram-positive bacteria) TaxID=192944 RepID=UPI0033D0D9EC